MSGERPSSGYLRVLNLFDATTLVIGSIIGAGIFLTPQEIGTSTQTVAAMIGVWILGGLIALTGSLTYAELGGLYPRAGGVYVFLREAYGGLPAFLYGWAVILVIAPGALAIVAGFFARNLIDVVPFLDPSHEKIVALAVIVPLILLNIRGVKWGSLVQSVFTVGKLVAIGLLILGGLLYTGAPLPPVAPGDVVAPNPSLLLGFLAAMVPVLFSYGGWQNGTYVAAEVRHPERNVPRAIIFGTLVVILCYVLVNWSYLRVLSPGAIAGSTTFAALAAHQSLGALGGWIVTLGILFSTYGICAAILLTNPRVAQAVGEDGLFFGAFGRLHPRYRTPTWPIAVLGLWACVLLFIGNVRQLLDSVIFADWAFFSLTAGSLLILRRKARDAPRPYRCHGYPFVPVFFLLLAVAMVVIAIAKADATSLLLGAGLLGAGIPVYLLFRAFGPGSGGAQDRAARRLLAALFDRPELLAGTSLRREHRGRVMLVRYELEERAEEGDADPRISRLHFSIIRHPRPYPYSRQVHEVLELWSYDVASASLQRVEGENLSRRKGTDGDPSSATGPGI